MIRFPNFEPYIRQDAILDRGMNMYNDNRVTEIISTGLNRWQADVESESDEGTEYSVSITIRDHKVTYHRCDCPFRFGPICKHRVAVLFEIRDRDLYESDNGSDDSDESQSLDSESLEDEDVEEAEEAISESSEEVIVKSKKKDSKKKKVEMKKPTQPSMFDNDDDDILGPSLIKKEMECQVCLSSLKEPILLPCQSHSICYECFKTLLDKKPASRGTKIIMCPTCGKTGGEMKVKSKKDLKVNKELERIKSTYEQERTKLIEDRVKLELEVTALKSQNTQIVLNGNGKEGSTSSSTPTNKDGGLEKTILSLPTQEIESIFLQMYEALKAKGQFKAILQIKNTELVRVEDIPKKNLRRKESPVDLEDEFVRKQAQVILDSNLEQLDNLKIKNVRTLKKSKK